MKMINFQKKNVKPCIIKGSIILVSRKRWKFYG